MHNIIGLIGSIAYIFLVLGIATVVARVSKGASETSRKLVHILVGNWVFFTPIFTQLWALVFIPFTFIIINSLSLKYKLISAMERNDDSLGTVYYAISMFVLSGAAFIFQWRTLSYIGLLTMAYGDGLAAIVGRRWGKKRPFTFAPEKTLLGSVVVAVTAFSITFASILAFKSQEGVHNIERIIFIALLTGLFAAFAELIGRKGSDNLSLPIGSGLFATLCLEFGDTGFFIYLLVVLMILVVAFKVKAITADGIVAAILTAITLYALGGVWIGVSLLTFFILGSAVSKLKNENKSVAESLQEVGDTRNWKQVLCNSLPACLLLWSAQFFGNHSLFLLLSFAVFSAAASDTFSSEIGMLFKGKVFNILNGKPMQSGLSGGVSWAGLGAGLLGSVLLSTLAFPQFGLFGMTLVFLLGFMGSVMDSILGVSLQGKYMGTQGKLQDKSINPNQKPVLGHRIITNNVVNLMSLSLISLCGLIVCSLVSL